MSIKYKRTADLADICKTIKRRHLSKSRSLTIVFATKVKKDEYFIFQEIQNFPINQLVHNYINSSITFSGNWKFEREPKIYNGAKLTEGNMNWGDIPTANESITSGIINARTNINGLFNRNRFVSSSIEVRNSKKVKENATSTFRLENISQIDVWDWGFSVRSPLLQLVAFIPCDIVMYHFNFSSRFPYQIILNPEELVAANQRIIPSTIVVSVAYRSFSFSAISESYRQIYNDMNYTNHRGEGLVDENIVVDIWDKVMPDLADDDFDKQMDMLAHGVKPEDIKQVKDIGQNSARDILLD